MNNESKEFQILFRKVSEAGERRDMLDQIENRKILEEIIELKKIVEDMSQAQEYVTYTRA